MARSSLRWKCVSVFGCLILLGACQRASPSTTASNTPPFASLEIGGQSQTASLGSYCWLDSQGLQTCTTVDGTPTMHEPLLVAQTPFTAHFHLALDARPDSLYLSMRPVTPYDDLTGGAGETRLWRSTSGWAGEMPLKTDFDYQFMDGPGSYVLGLEARWSDSGNVAYGFLVQVGPVNILLPTSTAAAPYASTTPQTLRAISPQTRLGKGGVQSLEVSADGRFLAIATPVGVYAYEIATQKQLWFRHFENEPRSLAFSPDGSRLAVGLTASRMPVVDSRTGETVRELSGEEGIHGAWSPDGKYILTSGQCEQVVIWTVETVRMVHELKPVKCNGVTPGWVDAVWSWDGKRIYVTVGPTGYVEAWDTVTYQPLSGYEPHSLESAWGAVAVLSPTRDWFALANGNIISILDGKTGEEVKDLPSDPSATSLYDIHWSPDGSRLLAENYFWDVASGKLLMKLDGFTKLAWLPGNDALVGLSTKDFNIQVFSLATGGTLFTLPASGPFMLGPSLYWEGRSLYTYLPNTLTRWETTVGSVLAQKPAAEEPAAARSPDYSPDGRRQVIWPGTIVEASTQRELVQIDPAPLHGRDVNAWSPDGTRIVSGDSLRQDPSVVWDAATGKILQTLHPQVDGDMVLMALTWSPDARWIAAAGSWMDGAGSDHGMIALLDATTGEQKYLLSDAMDSERIQSIAWSHDGHSLAAGMYSGRIVLWDMQNKIAVANLAGHTEIVNTLRWSEDDSRLASSSSDGTVLIWKIP